MTAHVRDVKGVEPGQSTLDRSDDEVRDLR
ncbi:hypothetical protein SAMN05446935_8502 [Burkholderia sp. YR290]|nr:hypothetical protein SAMN05446935_8502 [Burkholderia sp. YR290]